jgi:predicted RNA-binding protein
MSNDDSLSRTELHDRIAILEGNLRQLVEQAAGRSGGQTEERNADRIAQQREELDRLTEARDGLLTK